MNPIGTGSRPPDRTLHRLCAGIQRGRLGPSSVSSPQWKATRSSPCPRWRHVLLTRQAVFAGRLRCFWPRLCKNVFQCARHSKPDWKSRFYGKSTSADVPINARFNVEAHTSILATRFYTLWADSCRSRTTTFGQKRTVGDLQARQRILCPLTVIHRSSYPAVAHRFRNLMTALANSSG